jgi:hypothetical protein
VKPEELAEAITQPPIIYGDALLNNHDAKYIAIQTMGA